MSEQLAQAMLVIYKSFNGETDWTLVHPDQVPEWVKHPDTMAMLVAGNIAAQPSRLALPEGAAPVAEWYRAEKLNTWPGCGELKQ